MHVPRRPLLGRASVARLTGAPDRGAAARLVAQSPAVPPRDPRYRPFRLALWALYFCAVVLALVVLLTSIVKNLRGPHRPPQTGALPTRAALRVCVAELEGLHREQNARA